MSISEIFKILQIPETHDEGQIRTAYHRLLTGVNPEDDPEGFKKLRKAYEEALDYARTPEASEGISQTDWLQDKEIGTFLQQLDDVYRTYPRRIDLEEWKGLLSDPVFESLEDGETAKWEMFSYLAEHFRVPYGVWKLLDAAFFIQEQQQEMREHLPGAFVDYLLRKLTAETERSTFPYDKLSGRPDADQDGFFQSYTAFLNEQFAPDEDGLQEKGRRLEALAAYGLSHPWYAQDQAEYLAECGESERAAGLMRKVIEENQTDERIWLKGARLMSEWGERVYASGLWSGYLLWVETTDEGRFQALLGLTEFETEEGRLERAKQLSDEANSIGSNDRLRELRDRIHHCLIDRYTEEGRILTEKEAELLGKCYVQTQEYEAGLAFFDAHPEYARDTIGWHKQMAVLQMSSGHVKETLQEVEAWRQCLLKESEGRLDETEPDEKLTSEIALSAHVEARAWNLHYMKEKDCPDADPDLLAKAAELALQWHDRALELRPENIDFLAHKLILLREMKEDRKVIDLCEQILRIDPNFYWCYTQMQEAYERLQMAQQVVDTFYRAKRVYAGEPGIYRLAARVFLDYRQYPDALNVIRQAEEAGAVSPDLLVWKIRALVNQLKSGNEDAEKEWQEADACAEQVIRQLSESREDTDSSLAEAYLERARLYEKVQDLGEEQRAQMLACLKKSLELNDTINARYFLGRYYMEFDKDPKQAYEHLKLCEERGMDFAWVYFYIARCQESFKEPQKALQYYEKAMELNPNLQSCLWRMGLIWRKKFVQTLQPEYADKALYYFDQQEERFGPFTDLYRWRSYVRLCLCQYDKALEEVREGLKREEDSGLFLLQGRALRKLDRYEESIESFEKSIACEDHYGGDDKFCYKKIFQCFLNQGKQREGIAYFEKVLQNDPSEELREFCLEHLADLAFILGEHDRSLHWIEQWYGSLDFTGRGDDTWKRTASRIGDVLSVQLLHRDTLDEAYRISCRDAAALADQAAEDPEASPEDRAEMYRNAGILFFYQEDWETAYTLLGKAYQSSRGLKDYENEKDLLYLLTMTCYWRKDPDGARTYGEQYLEAQKKEYENCRDLGLSMEEILTRPGPDARSRLYHLFCYAFYTEQYEEARGYLARMCGHGLCWWCHEGGCTEEWEARGMIDLLDGKYEDARRDFENANRYSWLSGTKLARMMLRMLRKQSSD